MKRFLTACALGLLTLTALDASAQIRHQYEVLDNGAGIFLTLQAPAGMTGPLTWTAPIPPAGNPSSGFVYKGSSQGNIMFWDVTGTPTATDGAWSNASNFFWDKTSGSLTIGSALQSTYTLGVTGTAAVTGDNTIATHDSKQLTIRGASDNNQQLEIGYYTSNTLPYTAGHGAIQAYLQGTGATPLLLQPAGGNIGIGSAFTSAVPTHTLDVGGTLAASGNVNFDGNVTLGNASSDAVTVTGTVAGASPLVFDGATAADGKTTTFAITDPTGTNTITFPDATGTVSLLSASGTTNTVVKFTSSSAMGNSALTDDGSTLTYTAATALTNSSAQGMQIAQGTSGTAASGFGSHLSYSLENAAGSQNEAARIGAYWTNANAGVETSTLGFVTENAGTLVTRMTLDNSGNLNLPILTASQAVVTDASKNLTSLAYATAATVSTLAERDASGNLTATNFVATNGTPAQDLTVANTGISRTGGHIGINGVDATTEKVSAFVSDGSNSTFYFAHPSSGVGNFGTQDNQTLNIGTFPAGTASFNPVITVASDGTAANNLTTVSGRVSQSISNGTIVSDLKGIDASTTWTGGTSGTVNVYGANIAATQNGDDATYGVNASATNTIAGGAGDVYGGSFTATTTNNVSNAAYGVYAKASGGVSNTQIRMDNGTNTTDLRVGTGNAVITMPSANGTLALTGDINSAVSGTSNRMAKFTGTNVVGNSLLSDDGSSLTYSGTFNVTTGGVVSGATGITSSGTITATGTGGLALTNTAPNISISDGNTLTIKDNNGTPHTLASLADNGTTGTLTVDQVVGSTNLQTPLVTNGAAMSIHPAANPGNPGYALSIAAGSGGTGGTGADLTLNAGTGTGGDGNVSINTATSGNTSIGNTTGSITLTGPVSASSTITGGSSLTLGAAASAPGSIVLHDNAAGTFTATIQTTGTLTGNRTFTLDDNGGTIITNTTQMMYGGSNNALTTGATNLFNVSYGTLTDANAAGAVISSDATTGPGGNATGLTITATAASGSTATGLSVTAAGAGATHNAINATGDVSVTGSIVNSVPANTATTFDVKQGTDDYIKVSTTTGSENVTLGNSTTNPSFTLAGTGKLTTGGATVLGSGHATQATTAIPNNVTVYTVDDDAGTAAPFTLTLPSAGTDGQVLYFINKDADDTATIGSDTYTTGHGGTYVYFHTAGWTRVSSF